MVTYRHSSMTRLLLMVDRLLPSHQLETHAAILRNLKFSSLLKASQGKLSNGPASSSFSCTSSSRTPKTVASTSCGSEVNPEICGVCDSPCDWAYILKSPGMKALVSFKCRVCNIPVCCFCGSAGEKIVGDGLQQSITLPDRRMTVPSKAWLTPQRVCIYCYLDSYSIF